MVYPNDNFIDPRTEHFWTCLNVRHKHDNFTKRVKQHKLCFLINLFTQILKSGELRAILVTLKTKF